VVRLKTLSLGVGDFVVYSMALTFVAMRLAAYGREAALIAIGLGAVLIYFGLMLTVEVFLRRWGYGPALPIPMLLLSPLMFTAWLF
jgi:Presenilin.